MSNNNNTMKLSITCPHCSGSFEESLGWLRYVTAPLCPKCGSDITLYLLGFRDGYAAREIESETEPKDSDI